MDIKTYTSALVLTLLMTSSAVMAMNDQDRERLGIQRAMLGEQDIPSTTPASSSSVLSWVTFGYLGASSVEQLPSSSSLPLSLASSSIDQDPQSVTPFTRLIQVSWKKALEKKVTEGAVVANSNGIITVTSDNTTLRRHQVATDTFPVTSGEYVEVACDVFAETGKIIKLGLLNSNEDNWYPYHNGYPQQVLFEKGRQTARFVAVVPEGESKTSLIFYNDRETDDSPQFTIRSLKIAVHKAAPPRSWRSLLTFGYYN